MPNAHYRTNRSQSHMRRQSIWGAGKKARCGEAATGKCRVICQGEKTLELWNAVKKYQIFLPTS